jgi:hypothetical protein
MSNTSKISQNKNTLTKEKEVYNTAVVDKNLPTICFESKNVESMTEWDEIAISVSDTSAKGALEVFKKVIKELD